MIINTYSVLSDIRDISGIIKTLSEAQQNLHGSGPDESLKKLRAYNLKLIEMLGTINPKEKYKKHPEIDSDEPCQPTCTSGDDIWKNCEEQ